jgi:hypothetical protein
MSVVAIPGQPGLFRDERRSQELADYLDGNFPLGPRWHALRGLGDVRQDAIRAKLASVTAQYNTTMTNATKLLAAFGPLDESALLNLGAAIKALKARDAGAIVRITGAQFTGIVRMGLAAAKGNIVRAEAITNGNLAGHEAIAETLLNAAERVLQGVGHIVNDSTSAIGAASSYAFGRVETRTANLSEFGIVIADDVAIAAIVAVGVLLSIAILGGIYIYVHQSQAASDAADLACERDAAAGRPCTGGEWVTYRDRAVEQERRLSPVPDLNPLFQQAGSLLFWGGLAVVGAAIAYAGWTTAPAAAITRERLRARASRL